MKLLAIFLFFALMLSTAFALPPDKPTSFPILEKQLAIRQAHLKWAAAAKETSMDATIAYINEISNSQGSSKLSELLSQFNSQVESASTLTTHIALNNSIAQMIQTVAEFNAETAKQMSAYDGKYVVLLARIASALKDNQELSALKDAYWAARKENELAIFDLRVSRAQTILDKLKELGYDVSEAQAKLEEISSKRSDLEAALAEKNSLQIAAVQLEIFGLSTELARIVKALQVEIPKEKIVQFWLNAGSRAVARTGTIISELKSLGLDTAELETIHSQAETDLQKAKDSFTAGNLDAAVSALKDLKKDFKEMAKAYKEIAEAEGARMRPLLKSKIAAISSALNSAAGEMEKLPPASASRFCNSDSDCVLWLCAGCMNKQEAKNSVERGVADLPCATYDGYSCNCVNNKCTETK